MKHDRIKDHTCTTIGGNKVHLGRNGKTLCGLMIDEVDYDDFLSYKDEWLCKKCLKKLNAKRGNV